MLERQSESTQKPSCACISDARRLGSVPRAAATPESPTFQPLPPAASEGAGP